MLPGPGCILEHFDEIYDYDPCIHAQVKVASLIRHHGCNKLDEEAAGEGQFLLLEKPRTNCSAGASALSELCPTFMLGRIDPTPPMCQQLADRKWMRQEETREAEGKAMVDLEGIGIRSCWDKLQVIPLLIDAKCSAYEFRALGCAWGKGWSDQFWILRIFSNTHLNLKK